MGITGRERPLVILVVFIVFSSLFIFTAGSALAVSPPEDVDYGLATDEQQGGGGLVGQIIQILNGNNVQLREDLKFPSPNGLGLSFKATYNSRSTILGSLGYGWPHTYESSLDPSFEIEGVTYIKIIDHTGRAAYFLEETAGVYKGAFHERSYVLFQAGEYVWYRLDGTRLGFSSSGFLTWIEDEKGNRIELTYDANDRPETVTDTTSGRILTFHYNGNDRLEYISGPITDAVPSGTWVSFGFDANQNLTSVTYADGSGFNYAYTDPNDMHNLTEKKGKLDHQLNTWSYGDQDRVINNFSAQGKGVSITYVSDSQVDVTDAYGTLRTYTIGSIDERKRVTGMQGPAGAPYSDSNAIRWVYDTSMRLTEVEYAGGTINQYQDYDDRGNPGTVKLAVGTSEEHTFTYTYHPDMNRAMSRLEASVLGSGDKFTIWDYDDDYNATPNENPTGLISRIIEQGFTKNLSGGIIPYEYITTFTYNARGQVLTVDGPLPGSDDTTSFNYDAPTGNLLGITSPLIGSTTFSEYDAAGMVGRVTDVNNQSKTFSYDGRVRILTITSLADGSITTYNYNAGGQLESVTDPDNITHTHTYDTEYGRLIRITDPMGNYISYGYDSQGNRTETSYHKLSGDRTFWKRYSFQQPAIPGKLWKEINPDDTFTEYGYDSAGDIASVTDPEDHTTEYEYDPLNRLKTVIQPGNVTTSYTYNTQDKLTLVTDPKAHETTYDYDDMGRVISTTSPDTGTVTHVYDEAGNPVSKTDEKGITANYTYDTLNRLTVVHFPDPNQDITYTYDERTNGKGHLTGMTDPSGTTTFDYDNSGRLFEKTSTVNGHDFTLTYGYSPSNRLTSVIYPTARSVTYTRNSTGKVEQVSTLYDSVNTILMTNLSYLPFGPVETMDMGAGSAVNNVFDELYRMTVANPGAQTERTYTYNANGNITNIQGNNNLTKLGNNQTDTYTYIPETNKLQEITGSNPTTFTHDANGNITGIGNMILIYNQNNRLIRAEEDGSILGEYTYNGMGQRVMKQAGGITTLFFYDFNDNLVGESLSDGTVSSEHIYMGNSRLARVDSSNNVIYYYCNDHLGTPQIMTDENGVMVWEATYKPFGEAQVDPNSSIVNNFRLPGQYFDQETGLHYNYFRDYHPLIGRYVEPDPLHLGRVQIARQNFQSAFAASMLYQYALRDPQVFNLYPYVLNNPVNEVDMYGLLPWGAIFTRGGKGIFSSGPGAMVGGITGGFIGAGLGVLTGVPVVAPIVGGIVFGYIGAQIGGYFDPPWAGQLNYGEDEMPQDEVNQEGNIGSTIPDSIKYTPHIYTSNDTVERDNYVNVWVDSDGKACPPYSWSVSGTGFHFNSASGPTTATTNADLETLQLWADDTACGSATITVTDNCGAVDTGHVRGTEGSWVIKGSSGIARTQSYPCGGCNRQACAVGGHQIITEGHRRWLVARNPYGYMTGEDNNCDYIWEGLMPGTPAENTPPCGSPTACGLGSGSGVCDYHPNQPATCYSDNYIYYEWECQ